MSLCRSWIANAWIASFAGGLLALANGCGSSSGKPTPDAMGVLENDAAIDHGPDQKLEERLDAHADTQSSDSATGDGAMTASDAAGDTAAPDAGMEVGTSCTDNARNGNETDTDCGGSCGRCGVGKACLVNADCASGACNASHICVECATATNCPGQDTECSVRACMNGACVVALVASGTVLQTQVAGDCRSRRCDGQGQVAQVSDDTDLPNDGNPCTLDVCTSGAPSNPPASSTTSCGTTQLCDGLGHCVGCLTGADCPGTDNECRTRVCTQNVCGFTYRAAGTPTASQVTGDCKVSTCDGNGNAVPANLDTDVPSNGNPCNVGQCASGTPAFAPLVTGASCGGANICDGAGKCVECVTAANCPGSDTDCQMRTCDTHGVCGLLNATAGSPTATQIAGDCRVRQCNGTGSVVVAVDNTDLPNDNNACTNDVCVAGVAANPARTVGTACNSGGHCDTLAHCVGCITAADCPTPANPCQGPTCVNGTCGTSQLINGTPVVAQVPGDCKVLQCNASGTAVAVEDDTDLPVDGNACTDDVCTAGVASNPALAAMVSCGGSNKCDGQGHCIGCMVAEDCPGMDTVCQARTCDTNFVCGVANVADGTLAGTQTTGDCQKTVCNGNGSTRVAADDTDTNDDGNPCTANVCTSGLASNPPLAAGAACPAGVCDGAGHCVACVRNSDCGVDTLCMVFGCDASHTCRPGNVPAGSPVGVQVAGDCHVQQCDGFGSTTAIPDDTDLPDDGNPCTTDVCTNGAISHVPVTSGTSCGGSSICDGAGHCVQCVTNGDCGTDTACQTHVCGADHICGVVNVAAATQVGTQTSGDCSVTQCDGNGAIETVASSTDVVDDGNPCTDDVCQDRTPAHPPKAAGATCGATSVCDGQGNCGPAPTPDAGATDAGTTTDAAASSCPSPFLFCDDFEDGNSTGWAPVDQGSPAGTWTTLTETGHAGTPTVDFQGTGVSTSYHYQYPAVTAVAGPWGDQTVSVWVKPTVTALSGDNDKAGVCARFTTSGTGTAANTNANGYCLFIRSDTTSTNGRLQLSKKITAGTLSGVPNVSTNSTTTSTFPPATIPLFMLDTWYKLTLQVSGTDAVVLTASINDIPLFQITDTTAPLLTSGGPAVVLRGTTASFDDLRVSSP